MEARRCTATRRSCILGTALTALMALAAAPRIADAKSLYVITQITNQYRDIPIQAYDIAPDGTLTLQAAYPVPFQGAGLVGLAVDSDSESLFLTFEKYNKIQALDARTLTATGMVVAPAATNLAGIVYDHDKNLLYCVDRGTQNLYVYRWNSEQKKLTAIPGAPFALTNATAYGIALDEISDRLYVANLTKQVTVYDTSTWALVRTISLSRPAVSIAVDPRRRYLYTGAGFISNFDLVQYDLARETEKTVRVDPEAGVMGLGVNVRTGFVYVTTGQNNMSGGDDLLVFNNSLALIQVIEEIGNPTGLAIPEGHTSYNPLNLSKAVEAPLESKTTENGLVLIPAGEKFTYSICFDPADFAVTNVNLVDTLPAEVAFVRADGGQAPGRYEPASHVYIWENVPLSGNEPVCLDLVVRLKRDTPPGTIVTNLVTIRTNQTPPTTMGVDLVADEGLNSPLSISKTVVGDTEFQYVQAGEQLIYLICFANNDEVHEVEEVLVTDVLPDEVTFVRTDGIGTTGAYDLLSHTCTWFYPRLAPGQRECVELVVQLDAELPSGTTVTNTATITSAGTTTQETSVDVVTGYKPLGLDKSAVAERSDAVVPLEHVEPGQEYIYQIRFDNLANGRTVHNVVLTDHLPAEVAFIDTEGGGVTSEYDADSHTCTWFFPELAQDASDSVEVIVRLSEDVASGEIVTNTVVIDSDETPSTSATANLDVLIGYQPLGLSKSAVAKDADAKEALEYVDPGQEFVYQICFDNLGNNRTVHNVAIVDRLPDEVTFVGADGDGSFGEYDRDEHTYAWTYPWLLPGAGDCVEVVVRLIESIAPGSGVTNHVVISSDETPSTTASARVTAGGTVLRLSKTVVGGIVDGPNEKGQFVVDPGTDVTYTLCFENASEETLTHLEIVDTLPEQVSFVTADGDQESGAYDARTHTYTWFYGTLAPKARACLELVVHVDDRLEPNVVITNSATIRCKQVPETTTTQVEIVTSEDDGGGPG
ncbi:MAG: DUF11 domain-containing protein, partial [Sedimentisphaerales bacterium]|nr:DUF11 domain-containing protein [Sedimentisphaerales bacterium]